MVQNRSIRVQESLLTAVEDETVGVEPREVRLVDITVQGGRVHRRAHWSAVAGGKSVQGVGEDQAVVVRGRGEIVANCDIPCGGGRPLHRAGVRGAGQGNVRANGAVGVVVVPVWTVKGDVVETGRRRDVVAGDVAGRIPPTGHRLGPSEFLSSRRELPLPGRSPRRSRLGVTRKAVGTRSRSDERRKGRLVEARNDARVVDHRIALARAVHYPYSRGSQQNNLTGRHGDVEQVTARNSCPTRSQGAIRARTPLDVGPAAPRDSRKGGQNVWRARWGGGTGVKLGTPLAEGWNRGEREGCPARRQCYSN